MMRVSVAIVLALTLPGLLGYALATPVITTSPVAFVADGVGGFEYLEGPKGIAAVTIGSSAYALAASYGDNGVQIIDITDPFHPVPLAAVTDGVGGFEELEGARDITTATIGSSTYAIVTASSDDGIQIINITDPSNPTPASHISRIPDTYFNDPREVTTVAIGASTYALVAAHRSGVHIINITDPSSPDSVASVSDANAGFDALGGSRGITTTTIGSSTYAVVAAFEGAVQIMDITNPSEPTPVGEVHNSPDTRLGGATAVTTITSGSSMYALVAAQTDDAVQIIDITDPSNPDPVAFVQHGVAGFDSLRHPESITTITFGSSTYALVVAFIDGIQIIDVTNPSSPTPAGSVDSSDPRFGGSPLPEDMAVIEIDSRTYAIVGSNMDNGVRIIDVDLTSGPVVASATLNEETGILEITFLDTVDITPANAVDLSGLTIHDSGQSVSLAGATLRTEADSAVISIELTEIQSRLVAAMASPRLDISSSAVTDTSGNPIELSMGNVITINDDAAPEIVSVLMDMATGILEITFSDRIDVTPASIVYTEDMTIHDSGQSVSLAGATLRTEADSAVISIELTEGQRQSVATLVSPLLDVIYYGITDTDGNPIESSSDNAITVKNTNEPEPPAFQSAVYTAGDAQLAITFSKPINGTTHLDRLHVRDAGQSSGGVTMTGAADQSVSGDTLTITLIASQVTAINNLTIPQLDVDPGAVFDLTGVGIVNTPDQPVILINNPPTVDAGQDQAVSEGGTVTLNGTGSDPDGDQITYSWSHDSALPITISDAAARSTTFIAPAVDSDTAVTFVLSVSDGTNAGVTDQVTITILDVPVNNPPTVDAGQDQAVSEGDTVTLNGTASDQDGDQITYSWSHDSTLPITISDAAARSTTFIAPAVDSDTAVTFVLSVSDGTNTDVTDQVTVTIQPVNNPPTVDAGQDQAVSEGGTVTLNGTASDADGDALTYLWSHDSDLEITLDNPSSVSVSFTVPQVTYNATITFTMTVTDKHNATGSDAVVISILDIPPDDLQDPIADQFQTNTVVWNMSDQHGPRDISRITLTSAAPGTIEASWVAPGEAPANYRISWAKAGESYLTWTDSSGNAFPTDPAHTITGLEAGEPYNVRVRASYSGTSGDWSGDVTITIAEAVTNTIVVPDTHIVTDTTAPTISSIERSNPSGATTESRTLVYRITFSENVTGVGTADFALSPGSTGGTSTSSGQFTQTRSPSLAIPDNTTVSDAITVADSGTATSVTVAVDITHTYIGDLRIDLVAPDGTTKTLHNRLGGSIDDINQEYTPDFEGESIAGTWSLRISDNANFDSGTLNDWTLTINHGSSTASPVTSISGSSDTYYVTVSATTDGTYNLDLVSSRHGIADESSNPLTSTTPTGADETYTVSTVVTDTTAPTISSITRYNPSTATTDSQTLTYKVTFSEDVTGVGTADFALSSGSTGTGSITGLTGSGNTYHVTVSATTDGTYNLDLVSSGHDIADTASNPLTNTAPTGADETYTVSTVVTDTTAPTISSIERSNPSGATTESRTLVYRITFSEDVTGVGTADFALSSGSTGTGSITGLTGSGNTYHVTVSATTDGTYNLDLVSSGHDIADTASNPLTNTAPTGADETYTVSTVVTDTTAPTISSIERSNPSGATTESRTLVYRITFSEDVTGVGTADFALSSDSTGDTNGNNPVTSILGSGDTYYATVSATTDGTYNLDLVSSGHGIADTASNPLANTTPTGADETYTVSTTVVNTANPRLESIERLSPTSQNTNIQYLIYKATFSKSVTGVGASDFVLSPGSTGGGNNGNSPIAGISGSGDTYYVVVSPAVGGTYNLDLVSSDHNIADAASNPLTNTAPTGADETYTVSR